MSCKQFNQLSIDLTKCLSKKDKKDNGIYFTPLDIIQLMFANIDVYKENIKTILEPSAGSCEIINYIDKNFTDVSIIGIELNKIIYENIKNFSSEHHNNIQLLNLDYLDYSTDEKFDLIIGNPPYVVLKKAKIDKKYSKLYDGRPNLFILFIIHSLQKLNENGILAFILPSNFMNCLYYNKLRELISKKYKIISIIDCSSNSSYLETQQDTIIFIIQNTNIHDNSKYILEKNNYIIFNTEENIIKIKELYENSTTLNEINFDVKVGNITWNEHKEILTDNNKKTRLIYSSDIKNNKLINVNYKNDEKKNYIDKQGNNDLLLVVNRGYGKGKYKFNYCLIDIDYNYLIENHLIYLKYRLNINREELKELYNKIIKSFTNKKTNDFIMIYFGNNAINTTELQYILPIYD
jgi:type I restriction-modification system DNA methylase subunit